MGVKIKLFNSSVQSYTMKYIRPKTNENPQEFVPAGRVLFSFRHSLSISCLTSLDILVINSRNIYLLSASGAKGRLFQIGKRNPTDGDFLLTYFLTEGTFFSAVDTKHAHIVFFSISSLMIIHVFFTSVCDAAGCWANFYRIL